MRKSIIQKNLDKLVYEKKARKIISIKSSILTYISQDFGNELDVIELTTLDTPKVNEDIYDVEFVLPRIKTKFIKIPFKFDIRDDCNKIIIDEASVEQNLMHIMFKAPISTFEYFGENHIGLGLYKE